MQETVVWGKDADGNPITDINSLTPGERHTSVDGKLVVTIDKENGKITFEYPELKTDADGNFIDEDGRIIDDPREEMPIKVTITDADGDPDDTVVNLAPPAVNNPTDHEPDITPPDPENPDPDNPGIQIIRHPARILFRPPARPMWLWTKRALPEKRHPYRAWNGRSC